MMRHLLAGLSVGALLAAAGVSPGSPPGTALAAQGSSDGILLAGDRTLQPVGNPGVDTVETADFPAGGMPAFVTAVRAAGHETFDRFVLEFDGDQVPSYRVGYVEPPVTEDGSGRPVAVAGSAFLQVRVTPASGHDLSGQQPHRTYRGPDRLAVPDGQVITEAVATGDFESMVAWTIGLDERVPFGVAALRDPARLVVDVLHEPADGDGRLEPIGPAGTADVDVDAVGAPVVLTDVRLGAHEGFDRIVFELSGDGAAGYRIGYTDDPRSQGSGRPVDVPGDAVLGLSLTNIVLPPDAPAGVQPWNGPHVLTTAGTTTLRTLVTDVLLEGRYTFFAGLNQRRPFAVARLDSPQRIVVDVLAPKAPGAGCSSP